MTRTKPSAKNLELADYSDADEISSESIVSFSVQASTTATKMPATKRGRGRPAANRVSKPAQTSTRSARAKNADAALEAARGTLSEKSNNGDATRPKRGRKAAQGRDEPATEDMDDVVTDTETGPKQPPRRATVAQDATTDVATGLSMPPSGINGVAGASMPSRRQVPVAQPADVPVLTPKKCPAATDLHHTDELLNEFAVPRAPRSVSRSPVKRPTSSSDSEATGAELRRRIGDLTKKCDGWEAKYRDLRDIGVKEAELNFDRLRKQTDEQAKVAQGLISELRADVAAQRSLAKEGLQFKVKLDASEAQVADLTASLAEARKKIDALTAKLAASRSAEVATAIGKVPNSALKASSMAGRIVNVDSLETIQVAQMKEDLYGDLTGLIVRGIKKEAEGDVYDCIQTGRNGTLHFKLIIESDNSTESYQEAQFTYKPQLNDSRDGDLMDLLPDYLVEEITFPRPHAAKFFSRVTRSLMERQD